MRFNGDTNRYSTWVWYLKIGNDPWDIAVVIVNMMGISIPIDSSWFYTPRLECINTLTSCICTSYCWQVHDVYPVVTWNAQDFPLYIFPLFLPHIFPRGMFPRCSWWLVNPPFQEVYRGIAASLEKLGLGSFLIWTGADLMFICWKKPFH